jgi:hypothetical protein
MNAQGKLHLLNLTLFLLYLGCEPDGRVEIAEDDVALAKDESLPIAEQRPGHIQLFPSHAKIPKGESIRFSVFGFFPYEKTEEITAVSSYSSCAESYIEFPYEVANLGHARENGTCVVTASRYDVSAEATIEVTDAELRNLVLFAKETELLLKSLAGSPVVEFVPLTAKAIFSDLSEYDYTEIVKWQSSDPTIAVFEVSTPGMLRILAPGEFDITASFGAKSTQLKFKIGLEALTPTHLSTNPAFAVVDKGSRLTPTVYVHYSDGTQADISDEVTWTSRDLNIAQVFTHEIQGVSEGSTSLTASYMSLTHELDISVRAKVVVSLEIEPEDASVPRGLGVNYQVIANYSDGTQSDVTSSTEFATSDPVLAILDSLSGINGRVIGKFPGGVAIIAAFGGHEVTSFMQVTQATLVDINFNVASLDLVKGETFQLVATGIYSDETTAIVTESVSWQSTETSAVSVSNTSGTKGFVTTNGVNVSGLVKVRAVTESNFIKPITVKVTPAEIVSLAFVNPTPTQALGDLDHFTLLTVRATYTDGSLVLVTPYVDFYQVNSGAGLSLAAIVSNAPGSKGKVITVAEGTTRLTAQISGYQGVMKTASVDFVVTPIEVEAFRIALSDTTFDIGEQRQVYAYAEFTDGSEVEVSDTSAMPGYNIIWTSNIPGQASINASGLITAASEGPVTISAQFQDSFTGQNYFRSVDISVYTPCAVGTRYSYYCWFLGNSGESCDDICGLGFVHSATANVAGSGAANGNECLAVLRTIDGAIENQIDHFGVELGGSGLGCARFESIFINANVRFSSPATTYNALHADYRRACACR